MRLKTFRSPDIATALARARAELGPNALVLATNEVSGRLGLRAVEITVGVDEPVDGPAEQELQRLSGEIATMRRRLDASTPAEPAPVAPPVATAEPSAALDQAVRALVGSGLSEDLARRFARAVSRRLPPRADAASLAAASGSGMAEVLPFRPTPLAGRVTFVVGPSGVGKTTTVAKLAARLALRSRRNVVFGVADGERVGATEQAEIYCRHIGSRLVSIASPADLARAVEQAGKQGRVLVDTAGIDAGDEPRLVRLAGLRRAMPDAEVVLLIPAGLQREEAARVIERFLPIEPTCAAFAKVDGGGRLGELVTALAPSELPLAFLTLGHRVPDDLEDASPRALAARLLRRGAAAANPAEMP